VYQHASNQYIYLASLFALGFLVFGPQLLIGVAAVGFVPKKAIGAADGIKGTFAYLIGDSFAKLGLGMIADGRRYSALPAGQAPSPRWISPRLVVSA